MPNTSIRFGTDGDGGEGKRLAKTEGGRWLGRNDRRLPGRADLSGLGSRRVGAVASTVSLLLSVAVCVVWLLVWISGSHVYAVWYWTENRELPLAEQFSYTEGPAVVETLMGVDRHGIFWSQGSIHFEGGLEYLEFIRRSLGHTAAKDQVVRGWDSRRVDAYLLQQSVPPELMGGYRGHGNRLRLPYPVAVVVLLFPPALWSVLRAVHKRVASQRCFTCRSCGYDLRASVGRCPECGTPMAEMS